MNDIKERLGDKVSRQIRHDITSGRWKQNDKIPSEGELMEMYSVGRSTIREAVRSLVEIGILTVQQGSGTFVNEVNLSETIDQRLRRADFDELNAVRKLLELEIVNLAVINRSTENLELISEQLKARKDAIFEENRQDCINADIAFHAAIADASANKVLADLYRSFTTLIRDFFLKREKQGLSHFAMSHHLHEQLYLAIQQGDAAKARQITNEILENNY
ncbi:FadR/GntR family transcriptional regulator [Pedobacter sp. BMA]|uniref:FadR/GntR family transcriptional regulator n=1 Tax=Pedobacter sp. BMA TaxID=1663685 RepID=UPI00064ADA0B|nr:GntR family transcriptional regulator [Pedobacter sp. BMA]KLT63840.1 transcriptional regulator [Pedobacter sp. BMA]